MNFLYTVAVTAVVAVMFGLCYQYLNLQSEVKTNAAAVSDLEMQLNTLTSQNDEREAQAEADIDYDAIYVSPMYLFSLHSEYSDTALHIHSRLLRNG